MYAQAVNPLSMMDPKDKQKAMDKCVQLLSRSEESAFSCIHCCTHC